MNSLSKLYSNISWSTSFRSWHQRGWLRGSTRFCSCQNSWFVGAPLESFTVTETNCLVMALKDQCIFHSWVLKFWKALLPFCSYFTWQHVVLVLNNYSHDKVEWLTWIPSVHPWFPYSCWAINIDTESSQKLPLIILKGPPAPSQFGEKPNMTQRVLESFLPPVTAPWETNRYLGDWSFHVGSKLSSSSVIVSANSFWSNYFDNFIA